jgi:hypothetical protein
MATCGRGLDCLDHIYYEPGQFEMQCGRLRNGAELGLICNYRSDVYGTGCYGLLCRSA